MGIALHFLRNPGFPKGADRLCRERSGAVGKIFAAIAIDGPAASGKTSVARSVARHMGYLYVDTGAMYRAVTLLAMRAGLDLSSEEAVMRLLRDHPLEVRSDQHSASGLAVGTDGVVLSNSELSGNQVSTQVSVIAAHPAVRTELVRIQQALAARHAVVMAGRDIGTVVLPKASVKVFLSASVQARTRRRSAELTAKGVSVNTAVVEAQIRERDHLDGTRPASPLRPASDAVVIDSSEMSVEQVVERIVELAVVAGPSARGHCAG